VSATEWLNGLADPALLNPNIAKSGERRSQLDLQNIWILILIRLIIESFGNEG